MAAALEIVNANRLIGKLTRSGDMALAGLQPAIQEATSATYDTARGEAPVKTGATLRSIKMRPARIVGRRISGGVTVADPGALSIEYGTSDTVAHPFMRRGFLRGGVPAGRSASRRFMDWLSRRLSK